MGGETRGGANEIDQIDGLSPRGRGNLADRELGLDIAGSIPAWAGKPTLNVRHNRACRVYPRVGGETARSSATSAG